MSEALQQEIRHLRTLEGSARDPRDRVFLPLADAHHRLGDLAAAEALLTEGLTRHPDLVAAHVLMARVHEALGDLDEAEETWAAARRLDPENSEALLALGRILVLRGEAMGGELILKARALDPTAGGQEPDADLVSVDDLAPADRPDDPAPADEASVVSVAELAPHADVVSIADLAPDAPGVPSGGSTEPRPTPTTPRGDRRVVTRTLAELLAGQGQRERAIEMYEELVARAPHDPVLLDRLAELRRTPPAGTTGTAESAVHPVGAGRDVGRDMDPDVTAVSESGAGDEEDDRDHVDHRIARPAPDPDTPTPFAWTGDDEDVLPAEASEAATRRGDPVAGPGSSDGSDGGGEASAAEMPISDYLGGLLSRSPRPPSGDASGS